MTHNELKVDIVIFGLGSLTKKIISNFAKNNYKVLCVTNNHNFHDEKYSKSLDFMTYKKAVEYQIISNSTIFTWRQHPNFIENRDRFFEWLRSDLFLTERSFLLSSASVYRDSPVPLTESPKNLEAQVELNDKFLLEIMLTDTMKYKNSSHLNLRISNVYGADLDYGFIGSLMRAIEGNVTINLIEDLEVVRDYIYVDDVVFAIQELIKINLKKKILNISTGIGTTTDQIFEIFADKGFHFQKLSRISKVTDLKKVSILDCGEIANLMNWRPRKIDSALSLMLGK